MRVGEGVSALIGLGDATLSNAREIQFAARIFKEGRTYVVHALELDVSSCGGSKEKALRNLKEAVRLFLEETEKMGTLDQILQQRKKAT